MVCHNRSNYDYHFIIKILAKEFEVESNCLGENTDKYKTSSVLMTKEVKRTDKIEKKIQKPYLKNQDLLIVQDLWQVQCQTLSIILLEEFIKLNAIMDMIIKNAKHVV